MASTARPSSRPTGAPTVVGKDGAMGEVHAINATRDARTPHEARLALDHPGRGDVLAAHARALDRGEAGYRDPSTGLFVMTSAYLAARGECCGNGCRHCPYC